MKWSGLRRNLVATCIFVCGHRPKTKELLELFLFLSVTIWFISSLKEFKRKKLSLAGIQTWDLQITSPALYHLSYRDIVMKVFENYLLKDFKNFLAFEKQ